MEFSIALVLFAVASTGTPGPNNMMIMASGLNFGVQRSIPHLLGIISGVPVMMFMLGIGLDQVFKLYPGVFTLLKVLGCTYLLYLAFKISRMKVDAENVQTTKKPMTYVQALLFQWVNPKAWVISIGAIAAFTVNDASMQPQITTIALTFSFVGLICVGSWMAAGRLLQTIIKDDRDQRRFNTLMGVLLAVSVVPMIL